MASAQLVIGFPNVDWTSLQSVYGWPALQYQAWARGSLAVQRAQTIVLYTDGVLEFWVDDKSYFGGDFYGYHNAPLVLYLEPGDHKVDVRLIRDVRAFGANEEPSLELELRCERSKDHLALDVERLLVADIADGILASSFATVPVRNEGSTWIDIRGIQSKEVAL